jgi:endonuclease-3
MAVRRSTRLIEGTKSKYFLKKGPKTTETLLPNLSATVVQDEIKVKQEEVQIPVKSEDGPRIPIKKECEASIPIKREIEDDLVPKINEESSSSTKKRKAAKIEVEQSQTEVPRNFYPIYEQVKLMRSLIVAPVDTMGCAEIPITLNRDIPLSPKNYRFQLLISLMLSSQTKDEVNYKAMSNMKEYFLKNGFNDGITLEAMQWVEERKLDELIFSVGFHTRKANYIKRSVEILASEWEGDIPNTVDGLVGLPGVGPKMAFLTLQKAWDLNLGIGVDVHVDRLSKMWRWVKNKKGPEETRVELESWLPKELWTEINPELVGFGQSICLPRGRRCDLCTLSKLNLCNNVDRALIRKIEGLGSEKVDEMNKKLRFDPKPLMDIEDLA